VPELRPQQVNATVPSRVGITIGIDFGDVWSRYCTLNEDGQVADRGRFRTNAAGVDKRFRDIEEARVAMENGTHSIWVSEQIKRLGHEVIVANVRELRAISHSDRKSDKVDAEKNRSVCSARFSNRRARGWLRRSARVLL
jgi:transposase